MPLLQLAARAAGLAVAVHMAQAQSVCTENCQDSCSQQTFSACTGVECTNTVTGSVLTCQGALFGNASSVMCAGGACQNAQVDGSSTVSCTGSDTCNNARVNQSKIDCLDGACEGGQFYTSAVYCEEYLACGGSTVFQACACCDGYSSSCGGATSCTADPVGFCSSTFLGRTCAEWGNPACSAYDIPASGNPAVTECRRGDCVNGKFNGESVWCDNKSNGASTPTCQSSTFRNNRVECEAGSCKTSSFSNSEVRCLDTIGENSCDQSIFNQSLVQCYDGACQSSDFHSSALYCDVYSACASSSSFPCSCCDGYALNCAGLPSCKDDPVGFCSSKFLGRTCKDWENPVCSTISVDEQSVDVTICDKGSCAGSSITEASVFCNNKGSAAVPATCESTVFQNSLVYCIAGACRNSDFDGSDVSCVEGRGDSDSCASSSFHQSKASCYDSSCGSSVFEASEVFCDGYLSCKSATFDDCSCCDGSPCPIEIPSCSDDPVGFCSGREINGMTCAALGNPICNGIGGPTILPVAPATPNPPAPRPPTETTGTPEMAVTAAPASSSQSPIVTSTESPPTSDADTSTNAPTASPASPPNADGDTSIDAQTASPASPPIVDAAKSASPTTFDTTAPAAQASSIPTVSTECGEVNEVTAVSGIQITIHPCSDNVNITTVTTWPRNGSVTVRENGSVVYTPNVGFVGLDVIGLATCNPSGDCFDETINVTVSAPQETTSLKSDDGGSQAHLAALAVIPIVVCVAGYLIYKRKKTEANVVERQDNGPSFKQGGNVNASTVNRSVSGPTFSLSGEPQVAQQDPPQPAPPQYPENNLPGRPTFKNQVHSVETQRTAAAQQPGCDDGGGGGLASAKPMHSGVGPADFYEINVKDQCRNAPVEGMNHDDPPLASAVAVEETAEREAPDVLRIDL